MSKVCTEGKKFSDYVWESVCKSRGEKPALLNISNKFKYVHTPRNSKIYINDVQFVHLLYSALVSWPNVTTLEIGKFVHQILTIIQLPILNFYF